MLVGCSVGVASLFSKVPNRKALSCGDFCWLPVGDRAERNLPAVDLVELWVGHLDEQGQAWCPHAHLQLSAQEAVGEVEPRSFLSPRLRPVNVNVVAAF